MVKNSSIFYEYILFCLLAVFSLILAFGGNFSNAVTDGVRLWAASVLPSLFPYFFITTALCSLSVTGKLSSILSPVTTRVFNVGGGCGYALIISLISGYPIGAKTVSDLYEKKLIGKSEAVRAAALCSTSSPMFLIGSVGTIMFNCKEFGIALFLTHILSCFAVGLIFSFYKRKDKPTVIINRPLGTKINNLLYESCYSAVISILMVGGLITIFYLITEILITFNLLLPLTKALETVLKDQTAANALSLGLFECTKGLKTLSALGVNAISLPLAAFITGFGGLSVIAQSIAYLKKAKIKTAPFLVAKITQAVISAILGFIVCLIFF